MHIHSIERWTHEHVFLGEHHARNERQVWFTVALTLAMMVAEIAGGTAFGSLALVADGWHMSTHTAALAFAALAYLFDRRHAHDPRFAFGTGKLGDLAGFASAIVLAMIAIVIGFESVARLLAPVPIAYNEAIGVAVIGRLVNLASAWLLHDGHDHHHGSEHGGHDHDHIHHFGHDRADHSHAEHDHLSRSQPRAHRDHNLRSAYVHALADAATSVPAIAGLLVASYLAGISWIL